MSDEDLFAALDGFDDQVDQQGILFVETLIVFMEVLKLTPQGYMDYYHHADQQLSYLEERIAGLRQRFSELPAPKS
jgi:hypothetical protein